MGVAGSTARRGPIPRPAAQRVLARIVISDTGYGTPCWLFQGALTGTGYGNIGSRRDNRDDFGVAHRVIYAAAYGAISPGLQVDHLCNTRRCVNPAHLEAVTPYENNRREQLRRSGPVTSWLHAGQHHIHEAGRPDPSAAEEAMRRSGCTLSISQNDR